MSVCAPRRGGGAYERGLTETPKSDSPGAVIHETQAREPSAGAAGPCALWSGAATASAPVRRVTRDAQHAYTSGARSRPRLHAPMTPQGKPIGSQCARVTQSASPSCPGSLAGSACRAGGLARSQGPGPAARSPRTPVGPRSRQRRSTAPPRGRCPVGASRVRARETAAARPLEQISSGVRVDLVGAELRCDSIQARPSILTAMAS